MHLKLLLLLTLYALLVKTDDVDREGKEIKNLRHSHVFMCKTTPLFTFKCVTAYAIVFESIDKKSKAAIYLCALSNHDKNFSKFETLIAKFLYQRTNVVKSAK